MGIFGGKVTKHCRWCGKQYYAAKPVGKDGFDLPRCKQAHHRAYKKYVTGSAAAATRPGSGPGRKK